MSGSRFCAWEFDSTIEEMEERIERLTWVAENADVLLDMLSSDSDELWGQRVNTAVDALQVALDKVNHD